MDMNQLPPHHGLTCTEVQDALEVYLGNALDTDMHAGVAAHIANCPKCQDEMHLAEIIDKTLLELPRPEAPPEIFDAVAAYVRAHPDPRKRGWHRIFSFPTFWKNLTTPIHRTAALLGLLGIALFGTYQYRHHTQIAQASRDLQYALNKLHYAVERTDIVVKKKLPNVQIGEVSHRPFVQIEEAARLALKQKINISSAIHRSLRALKVSEHLPEIKSYKGDTP